MVFPAARKGIVNIEWGSFSVDGFHGVFNGVELRIDLAREPDRSREKEKSFAARKHGSLVFPHARETFDTRAIVKIHSDAVFRSRIICIPCGTRIRQ